MEFSTPTGSESSDINNNVACTYPVEFSTQFINAKSIFKKLFPQNIQKIT